MKIQLYVTPALSGVFSIIRYKDGVYDRIRSCSTDCENETGHPVNQEWARTLRKEPLLIEANRSWYGVSDNTEIYKED